MIFRADVYDSAFNSTLLNDLLHYLSSSWSDLIESITHLVRVDMLEFFLPVGLEHSSFESIKRMSLDSSVAFIYRMTNLVSLYGPITFIFIGTVGSLCNFFTFTSVQLKSSSCSIYLFCAAVFDLITIHFGGISRLLSDQAGIHPHNVSRVYCKIRGFIINDMPATATAFIVVASIDRFMSTSNRVHYRRMAMTKTAKRIVPFIIAFTALLSTQYIFFFDLQPACGPLPGIYSVLVATYSIVGTSIIPHVLMLIFGLGTYWHMRLSRNRIQVVHEQQERRRKSMEVQLIRVSETLSSTGWIKVIGSWLTDDACSNRHIINIDHDTHSFLFVYSALRKPT